MNVLGIVQIDGVASNASAYAAAALQCRNASNIRFQIKGVETGTPVGKFEFYGSEDRQHVEDDLAAGRTLANATAQWTRLNIPAAAVHGSGFGTVTDGDDHISWDGTAPLDCLVDLDDPPAFMYAKWVRASAGSSAVGKITVRAGMRGVTG